MCIRDRSNTFTIPDGPTGPAGVNGLEALVYKKLTLIGNDPIVGRGLILSVQDFNRTPMVGEYLEISGYTYSKAKTCLLYTSADDYRFSYYHADREKRNCPWWTVYEHKLGY